MAPSPSATTSTRRVSAAHTVQPSTVGLVCTDSGLAGCQAACRPDPSHAAASPLTSLSAPPNHAGDKVGTPTTLEVDLVIGADGANSRVAKDIDAGEYDYAIAFQVRADVMVAATAACTVEWGGRRAGASERTGPYGLHGDEVYCSSRAVGGVRGGSAIEPARTAPHTHTHTSPALN